MEMGAPRPPDEAMNEKDPTKGPHIETNLGAKSKDNPTHNPLGDDTEPNVRNPNKKKSMADMVRGASSIEDPQVFVPENIQNIGFASTANGIPSIYFSGSEIQRLASSLGHAIVGKFSHSIPASYQIQKALDNIKFYRGYTWNYINAKHILVQFEDMADYARLLSRPKGMPVWFIDRHPMRVFKWSPDFDAYCESPIAAIWCNLIGLPIHLYDQSALYAIGKLLGNPIQIDRATANKSRLSFARLYIEIDITKAPPEEIILDICGRPLVQQVKWDKIPPYCVDCKHVGHKSEVCYASGKTARPPKRNYNIATPKQSQHGEIGTKESNVESRKSDSNMEWQQQGERKKCLDEPEGQGTIGDGMAGTGLLG
ncbi:uncharacterized protein LOC121789818 [Salvia splendens]|uniref:uncharacterized protein LOC121789818 n=1 Tax=Salvia splendens TaxID=180675 RepID=UPI001C2555AB|nr:uncharacterized protein LOC121789818 [Salvia splendens]